MKKLILAIIPIFCFSQSEPAGETNAFIYDVSNYGNDFSNVTSLFSIEKNGAVWCQSQNKPYMRIGNVSLNSPLITMDNRYQDLHSVFKINGLHYFFTKGKMHVIRKNKLIKTSHICKNSQWIHHVLQSKNQKVYYLISDLSAVQSVNLYCFDGEKITLLKRIETNANSSCLLQKGKKLYMFTSNGKEIQVYVVDETKFTLQQKIKANVINLEINSIVDSKNFIGFNETGRIFYVRNGQFKGFGQELLNKRGNSDIYSNYSLNTKFLYRFKQNKIVQVANTTKGSIIYESAYSSCSNSYYCGTSTNLLRLFPHIRRYPTLFYKSNSNSVFSLQQDRKGRIWIASYQAALSIVDQKSNIIESKVNSIRYLCGGLPYKNQMLLLGEAKKGLILFKDVNHFVQVTDSVSAYHLFKSKDDQLYMGTYQEGLWISPISNIEKGKIPNRTWKKITQKQGLLLPNVLVMCDDKFGNIWMGGGNGIAIYDPKTEHCHTWESEKLNKPYLGSTAMLQDTLKNMWIGSRDGGLLFYSGTTKTDLNPNHLVYIKHPLLGNGRIITFIQQWHDYLILGAQDRILVFDLKAWYLQKKVKVRYLNPMEINLSSNTGQKTCLTDFRDESIWFASEDMVYQWDIKKWLSLPTYKAKPFIHIKKDSLESSHYLKDIILLGPTQNSFDLRIDFQTKDNMPRFLNGCLIRKNETPTFERPNQQTQFRFSNLNPGQYIFYVRICQQDGTYSIFQFPLEVDNFIWYKWWFWSLIAIIFFTFIWIYFRNKNQLEKQKKKLAQLSLSSLSNQFRPHFMLNALNSIGSQMEDMPNSEKVISRLGESINMLYSFSQKNEFTHSFENEWKLVENIIEIQRLLFIPELNLLVTNLENMPLTYQLPIGILQIPIENALLHGLRNKTDGDCLLQINFDLSEKSFVISITDNGVGRLQAAEINNFKNNGNGLKTIMEMIQIINMHEKNGISFEIIDLEPNAGTKVCICLSRTLDYEKIQL